MPSPKWGSLAANFLEGKPLHAPNCVLMLSSGNTDDAPYIGAEGYVCTCGAELQDDAGKSAVTPWWPLWMTRNEEERCTSRFEARSYRCELRQGHPMDLPHRYDNMTWPLSDKETISHLEGALREAEQQRDSAIDALTTTQADWSEEREQFADEVSAYRIKLREAEKQRDVAIAQAEEWFGKAEEGYRVVTGMWEEALRETGKDAVAAIESLSPKLDAAARYVSELQAKLREAEAKVALQQNVINRLTILQTGRCRGCATKEGERHHEGCYIALILNAALIDALQQPKAGAS